MDKKDFTIGQTVYLEYIGSRHRKTDNDKICVSKVKKVGNKYITTENGFQFHLEDGREKTEFSATFRLYPSKSAIELKLERDELDSLAQRFFGTYSYIDKKIDKLTQEEVATIKKILKEAINR